MKRALLAVLAVSLFPAGAEAVSRFNVYTMSCERAQSTVARHGEVLFNYRSRNDPNAVLFDRFVVDGSHCPRGQFAAPAFVPTADNPYCSLQRCVDLTGRSSRGGSGGGTNGVR